MTAPLPYPPVVWYPELHPFARRATDSDRDIAIEMLTTAAKKGQLAVDEHLQRLDGALHAKTVGDLVGLTNDLVFGPTPVPFPATLSRDKHRAFPAVALGFSIVGLATFPCFILGFIGASLGLVASVMSYASDWTRENKKIALIALLVGLLALLAGVIRGI
jgi:hypothetical protein